MYTQICFTLPVRLYMGTLPGVKWHPICILVKELPRQNDSLSLHIYISDLDVSRKFFYSHYG